MKEGDAKVRDDEAGNRGVKTWIINRCTNENKRSASLQPAAVRNIREEVQAKGAAINTAQTNGASPSCWEGGLGGSLTQEDLKVVWSQRTNRVLQHGGTLNKSSHFIGLNRAFIVLV